MREQEVAIGKQNRITDLSAARGIIVRPYYATFPNDKRAALL